MFCHLGHFFFFFFGLGVSVTLRGGALGVHQGGGNAGRSAVTLYVGEGPSGSNGASLSSGFQSFTPRPTIKLGHSGAGS